MRSMAPSRRRGSRGALRLDLVALGIVVAGAVLWIEHGHRIDIETLAGATFAASARPVCSDNENVPYSADCIEFMRGDAASGIHWRANVPKSLPAAAAATPENAASSGPPCPASNENVPYSANCLRFLSGWFWRANIQ